MAHWEVEYERQRDRFHCGDYYEKTHGDPPSEEVDVPQYNTQDFTWVPETRTLASEASSLRWEDAPVFDITSHHTGKVVRFHFTNVFRDSEGDISHWEFSPFWLDDDPKVKVVIYND